MKPIIITVGDFANRAKDMRKNGPLCESFKSGGSKIKDIYIVSEMKKTNTSFEINDFIKDGCISEDFVNVVRGRQGQFSSSLERCEFITPMTHRILRLFIVYEDNTKDIFFEDKVVDTNIVKSNMPLYVAYEDNPYVISLAKKQDDKLVFTKHIFDLNGYEKNLQKSSISS